MALYRVSIEGRRIKTVFDDAPSVRGFFVTRWVHAESPGAAAREAVAVTTRELYARGPVLNAGDEPLDLLIEDVSEATEAPSTPPGFVWYPEDGENS